MTADYVSHDSVGGLGGSLGILGSFTQLRCQGLNSTFLARGAGSAWGTSGLFYSLWARPGGLRAVDLAEVKLDAPVVLKAYLEFGAE